MWFQLYVDATNVISYPGIKELHQALSFRAFKASHCILLLEHRES